MANQCSKLNPTCMAKKGIPCPALAHDKSCWEYDWMPELKAMSKEERQQWKSYLHDTSAHDARHFIRPCGGLSTALSRNYKVQAA